MPPHWTPRWLYRNNINNKNKCPCLIHSMPKKKNSLKYLLCFMIIAAVLWSSLDAQTWTLWRSFCGSYSDEALLFLDKPKTFRESISYWMLWHLFPFPSYVNNSWVEALLEMLVHLYLQTDCNQNPPMAKKVLYTQTDALLLHPHVTVTVS